MAQQINNDFPPPEEINNDAPPPLERQETYFGWETSPKRAIYQIYFFLFGTVLMILSIFSYNLYRDALDNYDYIIENWKQQPIQSVRLTFDNCEGNEINLVNYVWPGTVDGCDCRYRVRVLSEQQQSKRHTFVPRNKIYNNHACNITQLAWGCVSIYEIDPIQFTKFPTRSTEGFKLCAIFEQDNSFYSHLPETSQCEPGYKKCGNLDDYFYCTKEKECPIYSIGFKGYTEMQNATEQANHDLTLLYSRSSQTTLPLVEVRITEGIGVCMKNHVRGITVGRQEYPLMRQNKTACDIDRRFTKILNADEVSFYAVNNQINLQSRLRGYEISSFYQWGIYARGYIPWKMECRGELFDDFIDQQSILESILLSQRALMIISIIFFAIISVGLTFLQYATLKGMDWCCIEGKGREESNKIFYMEIICKIFLQSIDAFIIIFSFSKINAEVDFLQVVIDRQCSDEYVENQLQLLQDQLNENIFRFNLAQLILFILTTIMDFVIGIYLMIKFIEYKRNKEIQGENQNIEMQQQGHQNNPFL